MTKRGTVFRVPVERFDVGAVPVPVFHLDQFRRGGNVQVGQDVRVPPTDPRARKLRTIDKAQQALALEGKLDYVYVINSTGIRVRRAMHTTPALSGHDPGR